MIAIVSVWRAAAASECMMPPPTTLLAEVKGQPQFEGSLRHLMDTSLPRATRWQLGTVSAPINGGFLLNSPLPGR